MENESLPAISILLVDDNDSCRLTSKWFLGTFGFSVDSACNAEEALLLFNPTVHDAVVTDNSMPGISGLELAHVIKLRSPSTPVIMYTGNPPDQLSCIDAVITRPAHILRVKEAVEALVRRKCL